MLHSDLRYFFFSCYAHSKAFKQSNSSWFLVCLPVYETGIVMTKQRLSCCLEVWSPDLTVLVPTSVLMWVNAALVLHVCDPQMVLTQYHLDVSQCFDLLWLSTDLVWLGADLLWCSGLTWCDSVLVCHDFSSCLAWLLFWNVSVLSRDVLTII